jgi:4-carboxymuconolactone decarboxylase
VRDVGAGSRSVPGPGSQRRFLGVLVLVRRLAFAVLVAAHAVLVGPAFAQSLPIEHIQLRGDRFHGLAYAEMTPAQRVMLDHTVNSPRAVTNTTANGPFNVLLRSPEIGDVVQQLANSIRFSSGLSGPLREIATLVAGRAWTSRYEWYAHARYAAQDGVPASAIDAIGANRPPDLAVLSAEEALAWRVAEELMFTRRVTDATYAQALATLGAQRLVSTATIAAYYELVSMILNVDRYPLPADAPPGAADILAPLPASALYRAPAGPVTARPQLPDDVNDRALEALRARLAADGDLPPDAHAAVARAVLEQWNRTPPAHDTSIAFRFAAELLATRAVADPTFAAALGALGERRLVNLIVLIGYSNIHCAKLALAGNACSLDDH